MQLFSAEFSIPQLLSLQAVPTMSIQQLGYAQVGLHRPNHITNPANTHWVVAKTLHPPKLGTLFPKCFFRFTVGRWISKGS